MGAKIQERSRGITSLHKFFNCLSPTDKDWKRISLQVISFLEMLNPLKVMAKLKMLAVKCGISFYNFSVFEGLKILDCSLS